ncbi:MAG: LOG family protein [Parachlamydiales bacterium]|jgi:hypothetical protein
MPRENENLQELEETIKNLVISYGGKDGQLDSDLVGQMIFTSLKLLDGHDTSQIKLMTRALKEMRHAFHIFNGYPHVRKISIFGSARTPSNHPDYTAAKAFSQAMAEMGWMCITGGAHGIMKAGLEGQHSDSRFGLSIRLPFESTVNELLEGDRKAIMFRYFFTRKLMFMSHSDALAAFPGGVGTMDELFEALTLMQTGKGAIIPVILMEGLDGGYWQAWREFVEKGMLAQKMIDPADLHFFYHASCIEDAVQHLNAFYKRYHSSRYVGDLLVIRLRETLSEEKLDQLNQQFAGIVASGKIEQCPPLPEEDEFLGLPRLVFHHTRRKFGLVRALIDAINS